jgi:hypothetical protein
LQWVERVAVPEDYSGEGAIEYPPPQTVSKLSQVLSPEGKPPEVVVAWSRPKADKTSQMARCINCRKKNHLLKNFRETSVWMCWDCHQEQTIAQAREFPAPTNFEEWMDTRNARSEDLTELWSPAAAAAKQEQS